MLSCNLTEKSKKRFWQFLICNVFVVHSTSGIKHHSEKVSGASKVQEMFKKEVANLYNLGIKIVDLSYIVIY